ncbi:MAG: AAA family ATPase [Candidatus Moranbacteria bacterium]|nr:AAA family ATPase [Candidatus Moranbacteria bacterium]
MTNLLKKLNKEQRKAAETLKGPVLVLAGAGSGKTRTLTYRIVNMINQGIKPANILAVTFTNKASAEMRERVNELLGGNLDLDNINKPWLSYSQREHFPFIATFHSFCLQVLKEDIEKLEMKKNFSIVDSDEALALIKKILKEADLSPDQINPKAVGVRISNFKNNLITPKQAKQTTQSYFDEQAVKIYEKYQERLFSNNLLDFDDIIFKTIELWKKFPEILKKYQDRYPYVLVDEYQDTNNAQYTVVSSLVKTNRNIFVVGDDYQSIYAWRGANINNILNFERDYKDAMVIKLEQNYRSTHNILNAASKIIEKNQNQKKKQLWTQNKKGDLIVEFEAADEEDEALYIVDQIKKTAQSEKDFNEIAVLYRVNAQSRMIEEAFLKNNIPYRIVGGIKFYQRAEIKDIVAYLKLANNFDDVVSFERIINTPKRKIGKISLDKILKLSRDLNKNPIESLKIIKSLKKKAEFRPQIVKSLNEFLTLMLELNKKSRKLELKELINYCLKKSGYKDFLLSLGEEGKTRYENVLELMSVAKKYSSLEPQEALNAFLEEASLATSEENPGSTKNSVTLMTLHSAKGLEFENVFLPGVEEGLLPYSKSYETPAEMEEERRLCYVGITRAMKKLWLIYTRNRQLFGQVIKAEPSRFLFDIDEKLKEKHISPPKINEYYDYPKTDDEFFEDETIFY